LTLLRITEQPTFLLTVIPRRGCARSFASQTTRKPLVANLLAEPESFTNSLRFRSRSDFENVPAANICSPTGVLLLGSNANGKVFATLCPSAFDHDTAVFSRHPHKKAVGTFAGGVAGLKCSFHIKYSYKNFSGNELLTTLLRTCQEYYYFHLIIAGW
jgi:hypothetical protein